MLMHGKRLTGLPTIPVINPATGVSIAEVPHASDKDIQAAIDCAVAGSRIGREMSRRERADILFRSAQNVAERAEEFARIIVCESGKTITQARKEVTRCVNTITLSAEEAKRHGGEEVPFDSFAGSENRHGYFRREPLGIILAITPFNDPLNLVAHKLGPAIAGGNSVILKPSSLTPLSAIELAEAMLEAGLPTEMLTILTGDGSTGDALVRRDEIRMVSFTGGMRAGAAITRAAGIKRIAMDLGGNAPVIVASDCDLEKAVESCVSGAFWAAGQNCIGVQRLLVHASVFKEFRNEFTAQVDALRVGDPMLADTDMGPMINETEAKRIEGWVVDALDAGATLVTGHQRDGAFYSPTVLTDVPESAAVRCQEVFAPVVLLDSFCEIDDAIIKANQPESMLHAAIFSNDLNLVHRAIDQIEAGGIMVNDSSDYRFDAMPFGGSKRGSMGREGVRFALEEMTQTKVVCFN